MKKFMSFFLILTMVLIYSVPAFAASVDDTIIIDGTQYTIERTVTDTYSQAILKDSSSKIVENFTYYFKDGILVNELTSQTTFCTSIISENRVHLFSGDESKYKYSHTERFGFTLAEYGTVALAAAIVALNPGVGSAVISGVISYAITKGLSSIYVEQECYSYEEKEGRDYYLYSKRITRIYGDDDKLIGGPWTSYQKIREK